MIRYIIDRENKIIEFVGPITSTAILIDVANLYPEYKLKIA